jgi:7-cyano-7-deazaguanine synthase in queuosine biosynthesis
MRYKQNLKVVGKKVYSYNTHVATICGSELVVHGWWSVTTSKHVNEVARVYGLKKVEEAEVLMEIGALMEVVKHNLDGFTVDLRTGERATDGYAVAPSKKTETRMTRLTSRNVNFFIKKFAKVFENDERAHLGGWYDKDHDEFVLDVAYVTQYVDEALYMAELGEQDAIFRLHTKQEIKTDEGLKLLKKVGEYSEQKRESLRGIGRDLEALQKGE